MGLIPATGGGSGNGEYTYLGVITNRTDSLDIPTNAKEIFILAYFQSSPSTSFLFSVPLVAVSSNVSMRDGYYASTNVNAFVDIIVTSGTPKTVTLVGTNVARLNSSESAISLKVYYR